MENHAKVKRIPLLVICGPTASGKTKLAVDLAEQFNGEVVSADSMQIYRRMDIGTAKPTKQEMRNIPHHLLDILNPEESFSLVEYLEQARACIDMIHSRSKLPILAGGTGLYIQSLIDNIQFGEVPTDAVLRLSLEQEAKTQGPLYLWERLKTVDPALAEKLHPNNLGRVIRGIEVHLLTGITMTEWQQRSKAQASPYRPCMIGLNFINRQMLYERIDHRVHEMIETGLVKEAKVLWQSRCLSSTAAQAIGYKELFDYFDEKISIEDATEQIKLQSRRYAKRQLTWLRRDKRIHWLQWEDFASYEQLLSAAVSLTEQTLFWKG